MPTYQQIQEYVREKDEFVPKTCWIAHVMSDHGLTKRVSPNRIDPNSRKYPCSDGPKRNAIERALRHFKMI